MADASKPMRIADQSHIDEGLRHLRDSDAVMAKAAAACRQVPLRLSRPGFAGLASIIVSQQVSKASAEAIFARLTSLVDPLEAAPFLAAGEDAWREAGLSRPKQRTIAAVAEAVLAGSLQLEALCEEPPEAAIGQLVALKGIGPWTAEVYLMFCAGHADIFPAGDLALQEALRMLTGAEERPGEKACREMAQRWAPWRSVAARMLWEYYRVAGRDAAPL